MASSTSTAARIRTSSAGGDLDPQASRTVNHCLETSATLFRHDSIVYRCSTMLAWTHMSRPFGLDDRPLAQRRDHGLLDDGDPVPIRLLDLDVSLTAASVPGPGQLMPVDVLEHDGLADPESLAVQLEHTIATIILDHVVVADGDHALAHLVTRGIAFFAPLLPSLPTEQGRAPFPSPSPLTRA